MGVTCALECRACVAQSFRRKKKIKETKVIHLDWADAVTKHRLAGIKGLHQENPDLINVAVDQYGCTAIHYAVHSKSDQILLYLLDHDADINAQGGPQYNTALHEAVLANNFTAVRHLYCNNVNDQLTNNDNKVPIALCHSRRIKRCFVKAKQCGIKYSKQNRSQKRQISTILFRNRNLEETDEYTIRRLLKETDEKQIFFRGKREEIRDREIAITKFGEECGVDLDEIAMVLVDNNPGKLWIKLTKNETKNAVCRQTQIYKILFGLTKEALKKKYNRNRKPGEVTLKNLTKELCQKLPRKKGKYILEKEVFVQKFHEYLFRMHSDMVGEESMM